MIINRIVSHFKAEKTKENIHSSKANTSTNQEERLSGALDGLALNASCNVKKTTVIPPKRFHTNISSSEKYTPAVVLRRFANYDLIDKHYKGDYPQFKKELNPKTLEITRAPRKSYHASNYAQPGGSIAIPSSLNNYITTDSLFQCAGVAFVDKKHNLQTLLHFCPTVNKKDNEALLKYIMSYSKPEDLEVTIVPGRYDETDYTVSYLKDKIKELGKEDINYANIPDKEHTVLVLHNGVLTVAPNGHTPLNNVNPENKIISAG